MKVKEAETFNPEMLIIARKTRGLTQEQLAKRLSIAQYNLSRIENGMLTPSEDTILKISDVLNYRHDLFFQTDRFLGIGPSIVYHRMRQGISVKLLERIEAQINIYRIHVQRLLGSVDIAECKIPSYDLNEFNNGGPQELARAVRASLYIPSGPIKNLVEAIEDAGGIVVFCDFGTKQIDGLSQWIPTLPPLFFINANIPSDRARFSLAHELGHVIMHKIPRPDMEAEANFFAGEFLMPSREISPSLQFLNMSKLIDLKLHWKVSMQALIMRAKHLGCVAERNAYYLFAQLSKAGYRTNEPVDIPKEQPTIMPDIIDAYLKKLKYTESELSELLMIYEDEFKMLYGATDRPYLRLAN